MGGRQFFLEKEGEDVKSVAQAPWLKGLLLLLKDLRYGSVTLVVQDGKIVQMERIEKVRLC